MPIDKIQRIFLSSKTFDRISWKDFFASKGKEFDLKKAYKSTRDFYNQFKQMNNELYPGEGLMDKEHLNSLIENVQKNYGNQELEIFYTFLSDLDNEKILIRN